MKIAIIALTTGGMKTALRITRSLPGEKLSGGRGGVVQDCKVTSVKLFLPEKFINKLPEGGFCESGKAEFYKGATADMLARIFKQFDGFVLIMAAGIAVRILAPLLQGKVSDPAVVVTDELGEYAISLLSGHLGGANDLARAVGVAIGAQPVITTSSDVQGKLAADVLATDLGAEPEPQNKLREVNSSIANGGNVLLLSEGRINLGADHPLWQGDAWSLNTEVGELWEIGVKAINSGTKAVLYTDKIGPQEYLYIRPKTIVAGVGCRRGKPSAEIVAGVRRCLKEAGYSELSLKKLVSIEEKRTEPGILQAAVELGVQVEFFSAETLNRVMSENDGLTRSDFVNEQMGVGGVCEPASLAGCRKGKLVLPKQGFQGVTVALARDEFGWLD